MLSIRNPNVRWSKLECRQDKNNKIYKIRIWVVVERAWWWRKEKKGGKARERGVDIARQAWRKVSKHTVKSVCGFRERGRSKYLPLCRSAKPSWPAEGLVS